MDPIAVVLFAIVLYFIITGYRKWRRADKQIRDILDRLPEEKE